jgi:hypothetical protein
MDRPVNTLSLVKKGGVFLLLISRSGNTKDPMSMVEVKSLSQRPPTDYMQTGET